MTDYGKSLIAMVKEKKEGIVYVSSGEGTTSQGEFHEAVNWASREKIPVVFVIQNNKWAISVPVEHQTAGKNASIVEMMKGYENLLRFEVDGTDFIESYQAAVEAVEYCCNKKLVLCSDAFFGLCSNSSEVAF